MELKKVFSGPAITPEEILQARTARAQHQQELLRQGYPCLVSFTLNIPGSVKQFSLAKRAFQEGVHALEQELSAHIVYSSIIEERTGNEALLCLDLPARQVKQLTVKLEECHPLGRLFDLDVLGVDGIPVSRSSLGLPTRRCLLCGQEAKICARGRAHTLETLRLHIAQMLYQYFQDQAASRCTACAVRALLYEVSVTPKPGLVDRNNSGSHSDMDFFTFLDSSAALSPWFHKMFCIGWENAEAPIPDLFQRLRFAGCQAEQAMFAATGEVNTHKGLIFSLGILCGALGAIQAKNGAPVPVETLLQVCQELGKCSMSDFTAADTPETNGVYCYRTEQITGVRGEAAKGFPSIMKIGLPSLEHWTAHGMTLNDAGAATLIALLAHTEDTNMLHRGGKQAAVYCRNQAAKLLKELNDYNIQTVIGQLDYEYIQKNLSPGGCADLLAISFMIFFLLQQHDVVCVWAHTDPVSK